MPAGSVLAALDPRRSLATAIGWLVLCLTLVLAVTAAVWTGELTRESVLEQRRQRAANAAEQWSAGLDAALASRRQPLRTAAAMLPAGIEASDSERLQSVIADLQAAFPELVWVGLADADGQVLATTPDEPGHASVKGRTWFDEGLSHPWSGLVVKPGGERFIGMAWPVRDHQSRVIGVVGAHLQLAWFRDAATELQRRIPMLADGGHALLVNADGRVVIGPDGTVGHPQPPLDAGVLVTTAQVPAERLDVMGWHVRLIWPMADVTRQADLARRRIMVLSLAIGAVGAVAGVLIARRLMRRLTALADAAQTLDPRTNEALPDPGGRDEASRLGRSFNALLGSLQRERNALGALTAELEQRVQSRTREVERLADESRYAAVVRERLRIARELHDTLGHSMMAMLMEVRLMRRLHAQDPALLPAEFDRAEDAASQGLAEARAAIGSMRFNGVRDLGLGPALAEAVAQFTDRSGLPVAFDADPRASRFADARAETVFRIAEEALRNIERHAGASRVTISLRDAGDSFVELAVVDDGAGFDTEAVRPGHYGLVGLKEQAQLIDATLQVSSSAGRGTRLWLALRSEPDLSA